MKENIKPLENSLENILKINTVSYTWKDSRRLTEGQRIGLIAQNVEKVYPQAVRTDHGENSLPGGTKLVNYSDLVSPIIGAIKEFFKMWSDDSKELHAKIEKQQREISSLKNDNADKDKQLNDIRNYLCAKDPNSDLCK